VDQGPAPPAPPPDPHDRRGLWFAVRLGLAAPFGDAVRSSSAQGQPGAGVSESNTSALLLPLWFDAGYRFTPRWRAGLYFQIADALSGSICSTGCGGYDVRFGISGEHHFAPHRKTDGWVGIGAGYEILHTSTSSPSVTTAYRGFEFGMVQLGADVRARGGLRWGPFAAMTLAEYDHVRQISATSDISITPLQTMHLWFFIGLRGTYDL
jgi:hypothetical protein